MIVYATALSGHHKGGLFHGGAGAATVVCALLFLIVLAGLTLPVSRPAWRA